MSAANMILCLVLGALLPVFTQAITRQQAVGMEANDLIFDKDPFNLGIHCVLALVTSYSILVAIWLIVFAVWTLTGRKRVGRSSS